MNATHSVRTITLRHGALAFSAFTCGEGPTVVLLHGFPDHAQTWHHQMSALAQAGYRAVAITLRGYEPGSQPSDGDYSQQAIAGDIVALIDALGSDSVHLVGHDWGAALGYRVAALAPERIRSLTALSVPHPGRFLTGIVGRPKQLGLSWYMLFFQLRGLAETICARNDYAFIRWLWERWSPGWKVPNAELDAVIATLRQPGVLKAALGYYRSVLGLRSLTAPTAEKHFVVPVPTLAIVGQDDGCIDAATFQAFLRAEDFPAGLAVKVIKKAGHFVHQEQASQVNAHLFDWLDRHQQ